MRRLNDDAAKVLLGAAFLIVFALGLILGATVTEGIQKTVAMEVRQ